MFLCAWLCISHYFLKMFTERTFNSSVHNAFLGKSHIKHFGPKIIGKILENEALRIASQVGVVEIL